VTPPIAQYPFNFLLSSILWALATLCLFKAVKILGASDIVILSTFGSIITVALSIIFLGDSFSIVQIIGTVLIIVPIILLQSKINFTNRQAVLIALLGTLFGSIAVVNDVYLIKRSDPISYVAVMSFLPGIVLLLIEPKVVFRFRNFFTGKYLRSNILYNFFYSIQAITYYLAIATGASSSQMSVIMKSAIIITVVLAAIFLKERTRLYFKLSCALVASFGVLFVSGII
jgi:uncharacterized membrane protein